jgi:hypothetical protein
MEVFRLSVPPCHEPWILQTLAFSLSHVVSNRSLVTFQAQFKYN